MSHIVTIAFDLVKELIQCIDFFYQICIFYSRHFGINTAKHSCRIGKQRQAIFIRMHPRLWLMDFAHIFRKVSEHVHSMVNPTSLQRLFQKETILEHQYLFSKGKPFQLANQNQDLYVSGHNQEDDFCDMHICLINIRHINPDNLCFRLFGVRMEIAWCFVLSTINHSDSG